MAWPLRGRSKHMDVLDAFHEELDASQQAALISWLAFATTFGAVRGITYSIKDGKGPFGNMSVGGEHLHHYIWGSGLLSGVGGIAARGAARSQRAGGLFLSGAPAAAHARETMRSSTEITTY